MQTESSALGREAIVPLFARRSSADPGWCLPQDTQASLTCENRGVPGRAPFPAVNRVVNPALRAILMSPIHGLASGRVALITFTGRRSGREYTIPCFYRDKGDEMTIPVGWPDRKVWWRNLTGDGGPVRLLIQGQELRGHAIATRDGGRDALVRVRVESRS
jgi:hypothetical protein